MDEIQVLINDLKDSSVTIKELSFSQVEDIVFHVAKERFVNYSFKNSEVQRFKKGPIDIIIKVPYEIPTIGLDDSYEKYYLIYVECKHYKRKLEFDRVAKVFSVALNDSPNELIIVSTSGLDKQAWEYVNHFFSSEFNKGFFKQIHFKLMPLEEIIGIPHFQKKLTNKKSGFSNKNTILKIVNLRLIETDGFVHRIVYQHNINHAEINISNNFQYFLELETSDEVGINLLQSLILRFNDKELQPTFQPIEFKIRNINWYFIDREIIEYIINEKNINITIRTIANGEIARSTLNISKVSVDPLLFFDIKPKEWETQIKKITNSPDIKLLFISGEAGIGKSHFCEQLCIKLRFENGFRCHRISIHEEINEHSLLELLWPIILPNLSVRELKNDQALLLIIKSSLKAFLQDDNETEKTIEKLFSGDIQAVDTQTIAFLLGRVLALNPVPQAIFIKDSHYLSPELIRLFRTLIGKLSDDGWGKLLIVFEYRESYEWQNLEFNTFKENIRNNYHHKTYHIALTHFKEKDIVTALSKCVIGGDAQKIASIVFKKAGGNPLFIRSIIYWGIDSSFIITTDIDKGKLVIFDWQALIDQIEILPSNVSSLLNLRSKKILTSSVANDNNFILYLSCLIYIGHLPDFPDLLELLMQKSSKQIVEFNNLLINAGILKSSLTFLDIIFVHELIWLALKNELNNNNKFVTAVFAIEEVLDQKKLLHSLAGGRLLFDSKQMQKSFIWYQYGYEQAKIENKFQFKRLFLFGCKNVLDQEHSTADFNRKKTAIDLDLAWNELQAGSQLKALAILDDLIVYISDKDDNKISNGEKEAFLQDAYWRKMVALTRLMNPSLFIEVFKVAFISAFTEEIRISILTRFILICCFTNYPRYAHTIAKRILSCKTQVTGESLCSLYSDIGRIYLQGDPKEALIWWMAGINHAESERQKCHMEVNLLIADLYVNGAFPEKNVLLRLKDKIMDMGVENQHIRLTLFEGIREVFNENLSNAEYVFMKALEKSQIANQIFWQWKCNNNLGIVYILNNKFDLGQEHFKKAFLLLEKAIIFHKNEDIQMMNLLDLSQKLEVTSLNINHPFLANPPYSSGLINVLIHNLNALKNKLHLGKQLEESIPKLKYLPINLSSDHPLRIFKNDYNLFFAIE